MKLTREQRRFLRRLPCHLKIPFAMLFQIENAKPTEMGEHKKGDERTAAWRYCECRICKELQKEEGIVTIEVQPGELFVSRIVSVLSK